MSEQKPPKQTRAQKREERRALQASVQAQELARVREGDREAGKAIQEAVKRERGRPSSYTLEQADSLCAWVAEGRSAKSWCRQTGVALLTVYRWMREHKDFHTRYARAHEDRADSLADEIVEIADEAQFGTLEQIQAARLRVDARKWIAAKLRPGRWGDNAPPEQRSNVVFNIGIARLPHSTGHTIDAKPLNEQEDASG